MQIQETLNDGLKRAYAITLSAAEIASKVDDQVRTLAGQIKMPGFRPGKVPVHVVRQIHGQALTGQVVQEMIQSGAQKAIEDNKLRPALQPDIDIKAYVPDADVEFTMTLEVLPQVTPPDLTGLKLERLVVPVADAQVEEALGRLAGQQRGFEAAPAGARAGQGDALIIDFVGRVDGEPFEGGRGEGIQLVIGSGSFIPGFEEQLEGAGAGEQRLLNVTFPESYGVPYLKGKAAEFDVTVKEVKVPQPVTVDDAMAKNFGLESLDALRELVKAQVEREHAGLTRTFLKRKLLDHLAESHDFAVPGTMVEAEFNQIWQQLEREAGEDAEEKAKLEAERDDYHRIAERRVRLGLLLSEIGQANDVQISQQEMNRLVYEEASRYPGQQEQVIKFFRDNPAAAAQLRAPLYEEKVVDFILAKAEVSERETTREALQQALESTDEAAAAPAEAAPKPKKPRATKAKAKAADEAGGDEAGGDGDAKAD